jgi:ribulose-5-phosphate 4-epimerase/fuculose-1-phosphate aldolase
MGFVVQSLQMELIEGCQRLARKGFLNSPGDSFSVRVPGRAEMFFATGFEDWAEIGVADVQGVSFSAGQGLHGLHMAVYQGRGDVGAVTVTSSSGASLLTRRGGVLPPLFDEQVRHVGESVASLPEQEQVQLDRLRNALAQGANALLLGERLLCLGMTCERVLFNAELYEKCARAYVIARESGAQTRCIPWLVRFIANRRLLRNERDAAESYRHGRKPEGISGY